jgi:hypothetical protein
LFTIAELLNVDLAAALWRLGIPASRLGVLVTELIQHGEVGLAAGLIIRADSDMLRRDLAARLMSASETVVVRRRGRPPAR